MPYKKQLIYKVKEELARHWGCDAVVIDSDKNEFIIDKKQFFNMCTFGKHILIRGNKDMITWVKEQEFVDKEAKVIMNSDSLYQVEDKLREYGKRLAGEHVRYLFENTIEIEEPKNGIRYETFKLDGIQELWKWKDFHNALNYKTDVIAVGAFDGDKLVALAGADNNMEPLWQIGIDTLPDYRGRGLAVYLVNRLAREIVQCDKIPFYTTWSPNIASCRVALSAGFFPAWLEYFVDEHI